MSSNSVFSVACWTGSAEHEIHVRPLKTFQRDEPLGGTLACVSITSVSLWLLTARCCQRRTYKFKSWSPEILPGGCCLSVYLITCDGRRDGGGHRHADHKSLSCRWKWFIGSLISLRPSFPVFKIHAGSQNKKKSMASLVFHGHSKPSLCCLRPRFVESMLFTDFRPWNPTDEIWLAARIWPDHSTEEKKKVDEGQKLLIIVVVSAGS